LGLKFRVEKVWKGKLTNEIIFNSKMYAARDTDETEVFINSCTFLFEVGKKYLVYAYRDGVDLFVNKCSRTQLLDSADEDVNFLDRLVPKAQSFSPIGFGEIVSGTAKSDVALGADSP